MNENYHIIRIQQYLKGELSDGEMHQLEREALDDPLLQDAIDGYRMQQEVNHGRLSLLQQRLATRIAGQAKERNAFYFGWQRLGVAATACVLMVLVLVLLWIRSHPEKSQTAEREVHVELAAPANAMAVQAVAVSGAGLDARPNAGWEQFNNYLANGKSDAALVGEIIVTFEVDTHGRPTAIHGVGNADNRLLDESRRLLELGPAWSGKKGKLAISFN